MYRTCRHSVPVPQMGLCYFSKHRLVSLGDLLLDLELSMDMLSNVLGRIVADQLVLRTVGDFGSTADRVALLQKPMKVHNEEQSTFDNAMKIKVQKIAINGKLPHS